MANDTGTEIGREISDVWDEKTGIGFLWESLRLISVSFYERQEGLFDFFFFHKNIGKKRLYFGLDVFRLSSQHAG